MQLPGRQYNSSQLIYGFNGKRYDNEVYGVGNFQDYGERMYDPRIVRFPSVDPITKDYPELTPYQFASNRPIDGVDQDGLEWELSTIKHNLGTELKLKQQVAKHTQNLTNQRALQALARQPVLKQGDNSYYAQQRSKAFSRQAAFNKEMAARAAHDPISYGGPGMGLGLARDPFVQTSAETLLTMGTARFITTNIFQTSTTSLSFSQQFLLKSSIDLGGQALISGPSKIDFFDATIAGLPFKPAYSALAGGMFDIRPFSQGDKFSLVGFNKSVSDFTIETSAKYIFGSGGIPGSFKNAYKGSFDLKNIGQLKSYDLSNYMIQIPFSLTGKGVSTAAKTIVNGPTQ